MKIGVIGEFDRKGGGSYHQSKKIYKILSKFKDFNFKLLTVNPQKKITKINEEKTLFYETNFIDQLFFLFYSSKLIKSLLKKFNIKSRFEKFLKKNQIDLIFFLGCSRLSLFCNSIDYVTYIYEFHHLSRPDLPEYKGWSDFDFREELLDTNIKKSLSLIVDTQKKGKDLIKYYNCFEDKINVIPLVTSITELENKAEAQISNKVLEYIKKNKEYFFYPAQYWSHKNHYYILRALKLLKKDYNRSIQFVFTGHKKNNFNFLVNKMNEFGLIDQITFFEYLNDTDVKSLYMNCKGIVMPSLVGYSSLPLYEAFFFEKPIFYTKDLLDISLQKYVNQIDIDDPKNLVKELINFDKNIKNINSKVNLAKFFFDENLAQDQISSKYIEFFNKIKNQTSIYK
ncbi:glycosyltransferase [Candidatus Pelagibacter ubique]|uniref:glycosyltransferase n=1 Tax=Pelagibacter ubique TaxID=198252 RepID=UPI0003C7F75D